MAALLTTTRTALNESMEKIAVLIGPAGPDGPEGPIGNVQDDPGEAFVLLFNNGLS